MADKPITREAIEARQAQLRAEQAQVQTAIAQLQANLSAFSGAIEDCDFWLAQLAAEAQPTEPEPKK
jgi:hypothetical protein